MKYRIFAHNAQVTAVCLNNEFINANGIEVAGGECDPEVIEATLAELVPSGVGSPWPPVKPAKAALATKPAKPGKPEATA
jgi:hypothetical protein